MNLNRNHILSTKAVDNSVTNLSHCPSTALLYWHRVKMTKNWPNSSENSIQAPETVAEAVDRLTELLIGMPINISLLPRFSADYQLSIF